MAQEWDQWVERVRTSSSPNSIAISEQIKEQTQHLAKEFPPLLPSFSFFRSPYPLLESSSEPTLKQVGSDFNQLIQEVKEDLGFLSFGL